MSDDHVVQEIASRITDRLATDRMSDDKVVREIASRIIDRLATDDVKLRRSGRNPRFVLTNTQPDLLQLHDIYQINEKIDVAGSDLILTNNIKEGGGKKCMCVEDLRSPHLSIFTPHLKTTRII